ncbi:hypothetical protein HZB01_05550 [Candidatus Woesearchaeota archaeon]|nr:hypothetical protein [Candidatus Woesearchaeota archaeon]
MNFKDMLIIAVMGLVVVAVGGVLQGGVWSSGNAVSSPTGLVVVGDASGAAVTATAPSFGAISIEVKKGDKLANGATIKCGNCGPNSIAITASTNEMGVATMSTVRVGKHSLTVILSDSDGSNTKTQDVTVETDNLAQITVTFSGTEVPARKDTGIKLAIEGAPTDSAERGSQITLKALGGKSPYLWSVEPASALSGDSNKNTVTITIPDTGTEIKVSLFDSSDTHRSTPVTATILINQVSEPKICMKDGDCKNKAPGDKAGDTKCTPTDGTPDSGFNYCVLQMSNSALTCVEKCSAAPPGKGPTNGDYDLDGVPNGKDRCPDTPNGTAKKDVDADGCTIAQKENQIICRKGQYENKDVCQYPICFDQLCGSDPNYKCPKNGGTCTNAAQNCNGLLGNLGCLATDVCTKQGGADYNTLPSGGKVTGCTAPAVCCVPSRTGDDAIKTLGSCAEQCYNYGKGKNPETSGILCDCPANCKLPDVRVNGMDCSGNERQQDQTGCSLNKDGFCPPECQALPFLDRDCWSDRNAGDIIGGLIMRGLINNAEFRKFMEQVDKLTGYIDPSYWQQSMCHPANKGAPVGSVPTTTGLAGWMAAEKARYNETHYIYNIYWQLGGIDEIVRYKVKMKAKNGALTQELPRNPNKYYLLNRGSSHVTAKTASVLISTVDYSEICLDIDGCEEFPFNGPNGLDLTDRGNYDKSKCNKWGSKFPVNTLPSVASKDMWCNKVSAAGGVYAISKENAPPPPSNDNRSLAASEQTQDSIYCQPQEVC